MADDFNETVEQFYLSLLDLKSNSKPMIAMLTQLAEEYKETDRELVKSIEDVIYEVAADRKLPYLYLIDSICKHVGLEYLTLFAQCLVPLFSHVYMACNAEVKRLMVKLRKTWCKLFPDYLLNELDEKMRALDESWPYGYRMRTRSSSGSKSALDTYLRSSLEHHRSENELQSVQPLFKTNQHLLPAIPSYSSTRSAHSVQSVPVHSVQSAPAHSVQSVPVHSVQSAPALNECQVNGIQMGNNQLSDIQVNGEFPINQQAIAQQPALAELSSHPNQQLALVPAPVNQLVNANQLLAQFPATPSHPVALSPPPCGNLVQPAFLNSGSSFINNHTFINNQLSPCSNLNGPNRHAGGTLAINLNAGLNPNLTNLNRGGVPMNPISSFNLTLNVNENINQTLCRPIIESTSTRNSSCLIPCQPKRNFGALNPNQLSPSCVKFKRRDNDNKDPDKFNRKRLFDSSTTSSPGKRRRTTPSGWGNPQNSSRNNSNSKSTGRSGAPPAISRLNPIAVKPNTGENSSVKINKVTTVDESVMMFESQHYKIYHLDETTSIMLLRCPIHLTFNDLKLLHPHDIDPRKVYFEGRPVKVHIDERDTILLTFGAQWKKFRSSNGFEQYIKFGTPDREIYLNDQIIKARFGGHSVACRLNGDEELHSIRLDAPPPSVRVSEDTRVDLWYQFIKKVRTMESNSVPTNRPLKFTKKADCNSPDSTRADKDEAKDEEKDEAKSRCRDWKKNGEPDEIPALELEPESLRVKRDYLIKRMYSGLQCTSCSLRFDVQSKENKEKYSSHLDWHFRKNRKARNKIANNSYSLKREWYYPLDQWMQFKEITLESNSSKTDKPPQQPVAVRTGEQQPDTQSEEPSGPARIKANPNDSLNVCTTCYEKFDEIWCDEEECWLLENATLMDDHYYHPTCLINEPVKVSTSAANDESSTGLDLNNNETNGKDSDEDPHEALHIPDSSEQQAEANELHDEPVKVSTSEMHEPVKVSTSEQQATLSELNEENPVGLDLNNNETNGKHSDEDHHEAPNIPGSSEQQAEADHLAEVVGCVVFVIETSADLNLVNSSPVPDSSETIQIKELPNLLMHDHNYFSPIDVCDQPNESAASDSQATSECNQRSSSNEEEDDHQIGKQSNSPNEDDRQSDAPNEQQSSSLNEDDRQSDAPNEQQSRSPAYSEDPRLAENDERLLAESNDESSTESSNDESSTESKAELPSESNDESPTESEQPTGSDDEPSTESSNETSNDETSNESKSESSSESNDETPSESKSEASGDLNDESPARSTSPVIRTKRDRRSTESALCSIM